MNIKSCEKKEKSMAEIIVEVDAEELDNAIGEAYRKNKNRISVPGFRKGKAPRKIIERMYGSSTFHSDALDILLPGVIGYAMDESELKLVGYPQVSDVDIEEDASGAVITIMASLYPEVKLGEYKGLSAVKPAVDVPESEVDLEVDAVRQRNARIEKVDRPAESGDISIIDFEGFIDGEAFEGGSGTGFELEIGSGSFIPGFEEKIIGMAINEQRDIDLVFPEEYKEDLAGKPVVFKVTLNELREKQLPELDDEFAKDVSEFDTLDEYKADIRGRILKVKQEDAESMFENALIDKLLETVEAEIPDSMVEEQLDIGMQNFARQVSSYGMEPSAYLKLMNTTPELFRENMRVSSEKQVKAMLALSKIAEIEGIEVSEDEIEAEYKAASERFGTDIEKIKESAEKEQIIYDIKLRRATGIITDNAIAEEPSQEDGNKPEKPPSKTKKAAPKKPADAEAGSDISLTAAEPEKEPENTTEAGTETANAAEPKKPAAKKQKKPAEQKTEGDEK